MRQQAIERDVYRYASAAQRRALVRLRREGWDITGAANLATEIFLVRVRKTGPNDECRVLHDGTVTD